MPSSISSSKSPPRISATHRTILLVLAGLVLIGVVTEGMARYGLHRISRISRRIGQEYQDARTLPTYSASGKPTLLLVGNSLLLFAVDYPALKAGLSEKYDVHRFVIEQTEYLEQYYILRKLFRDGSRPHDIVLCVSVNHLISDSTRGEFVSRYLDPVDILELSRREHFSATTTSGQLFAHWSDWYANRAEIRNVILGHALPDVQDLTTVLAWRQASKVTSAEVQQKADLRLKEIKALCDQYGSRLTILVPPALAEDHADVMRADGEAMDVRVLVPEKAGEMQRSLFLDGFHLTPTGAAQFTAKLQPQL
jgi:hypothetical protein